MRSTLTAMLLPLTTQCYRDTRPFGTYALLLLNVSVYVAYLSGWIDPANWVSEFARVEVLRGLRSQFFHAGIWHLLGNLWGLWIFGQVLEGSIGTRAFLWWLLAVALSSIAVEYVAFSSREGGAYGASGLVFACIGAGALLAPKTRIRFLIWIILPQSIEMGLIPAALIYLGLELGQSALTLSLAINHTLPFTQLLHICGFVIGVALAYAGLKLRWLDAGGWDWLSRRKHATTGARLGDFVAVDVNRAPPSTQSEQPACEHCGRVRPAHFRRCIYCGLK